MYKDQKTDDWTIAKKPRINRLKINDENNKKYKKAMSFRLLDLIVLYLFLENRKTDTLSENEKDIIKKALIDYPLFSEQKKAKMESYKEKILKY